MTRWLVACVCGALLATPAVSEAQYFGRNKVQYRSFEFHVIRTAHFDIYYYPQKREAALDAARMIERSYARLSRLLQHEFKERKPVILYASHAEFQQTNALGAMLDESTGGVTESAKHRIIMPFTGSYAEFDHVLTHELVHQFQFDVLFRSVAGDANPFAMRLPLWFMEGMAEYLAIGHVDPHTQSWLRDAVLAGYLRTIPEMNQRDDYLSYRFGQSLWAYIGAKWGDEVIGILLQKAPTLGVPRAIASTLGVTLEELSDEWTAEVRRTYMPQVAAYERPETFAARLGARAALRDPWYVAPAISPDGRRMVFTSQRDGFSFDLWLADARTGVVERRLVNAARNPDFESLRYMSSGAAFSPDGRYLAFAAQTAGRDALYIYDLQRFRVVKRLRYELNGLSNPSWSPDGRRLVFSGNAGGLTDLYVTDLNGRLQRLTSDRYAALLPAWSPDGRYIAYATDRGPTANMDLLTYGNYRIAIYDLDTQQVEILPHQDEGKNINAVWSPDGRHLVWVSDRTGTNNLYAYDVAEGTLERLTDVLSGVPTNLPARPAPSTPPQPRAVVVALRPAALQLLREGRLQHLRARRAAVAAAHAGRAGACAGSGDRGRAAERRRQRQRRCGVRRPRDGGGG
jgi:dipeptidyl aminopeptidase/acylaminoacyl peptidase